jgi:hypothetical protein
MSRHKNNMSCARVLVLIEPFLDGDLSDLRQESVQAHMQQCVDCSTACDAARAIQVSLRDMPALEFPAALHDQLLDQIARTTQGRAPSWQQRLATAVARTWDFMMGKNAGASGWLRPVGGVAVIAIVFVLLAQQRQPEQTTTLVQGYTEQELQEAGEQALWALAYLARVTARVGDTAFYRVGDVMGDVIGEHAIGSVTDAIGRSMEPDPVNGGPGKPEEEVQTP